MKKAIGIVLSAVIACFILAGCSAPLTDMVEKYMVVEPEDGTIYWNVYLNDDYDSAQYSDTDFLNIIKECMAMSGDYTFSDASVMAYDSDGYTTRFYWNSYEDPYIIVEEDGTAPNLREYEWNLTRDEVNEIWDAVGTNDSGDYEIASAKEDDAASTHIAGVDYWKDLYIEPDYDIYKTKASENGLEKTLIYVEGTITDKKSADTTDVYYLTEDNGNKWLLTLSNDNKTVPEIGDKITAYGEYGGQSAVFDELPAMMLLRYTSGDDMVKITTQHNDIPDAILYPAAEGYPSEYVTDESEEKENGGYHFTVRLSEWDDLDYDKQCEIAKNWVEYYTDYVTVVGLTRNNITIDGYDENGGIAFTYGVEDDNVIIKSNGEYTQCPV